MYEEMCNIVKEEDIYSSIEILLDSIKNSKNTNNTRLICELAMIKIFELKNKKNIIEPQKEIPILEEKKKIVAEKKYDKKELSDDTKDKLDELKKIRITNTLAKFDKKELITFKDNLDDIKELLMDPTYSSNVSLILDGELKAKGDKNLIFVYKIKNLEECFNLSLIEIENILKKVYNVDYKPIAVSEEEWEPIKVEFNKNMKSKNKIYEYKDENISLDDIFKNNENVEKSNVNTNEIEEMFEDLIVYN